ncbi:hypothetical protein [Archaeoglobus neptunius]|uniref:hypothetical protein n=1 Tax=Archaeoglobus neptunius TaxID=2798580 RepID=UPI001E2B3930|nr:hypothetical protein [Archaeoglobus neptunius]
MSERDLLIERLERKLAEKERELAELRRMNIEDIERIKREIISELESRMPDVNQKISELESKMVELRRAVESVITELTYVKGELRELIEKKEAETRKEPQKYSEEVVFSVEDERDLTGEESRAQKKVEFIDTEKKQVKEDDDEIIICD